MLNTLPYIFDSYLYWDVWIFFLPTTPPLCVYLDQRPGDSRAVADLCLPGWVQASCCFISPRVLWHLSLFTCSVMVIPSDRVYSLSLSLSFSVFLFVLSSSPSSMPFLSLLLLYHPPLSSSFFLLQTSLQLWLCASLATTATAQSKLNLVFRGSLKKETLSVKGIWQETAGDKIEPWGWRHASWDCSLIMFKMGWPLQSFNYLNGRDREGVHAATVSLL